MDGQTLFYRTLPATVGVPKKKQKKPSSMWWYVYSKTVCEDWFLAILQFFRFGDNDGIYSLFIDNYYNSVALAGYLAKRGQLTLVTCKVSEKATHMLRQ